jgi:hypothetical protein
MESNTIAKVRIVVLLITDILLKEVLELCFRAVRADVSLKLSIVSESLISVLSFSHYCLSLYRPSKL